MPVPTGSVRRRGVRGRRARHRASRRDVARPHSFNARASPSDDEAGTVEGLRTSRARFTARTSAGRKVALRHACVRDRAVRQCADSNGGTACVGCLCIDCAGRRVQTGELARAAAVGEEVVPGKAADRTGFRSRVTQAVSRAGIVCRKDEACSGHQAPDKNDHNRARGQPRRVQPAGHFHASDRNRFSA